MNLLGINFSNPWLLFLIIPAIAVTLIPYLRLSKKHRRTRNRVTSMVLHSVVMLCAILIISGLGFTYQVPNKENEVIFLVDVSETEESANSDRDYFIRTALDDGKYDNFKVGIVTFGFDQVYAAQLTDKVDTVYDSYIKAETPDTTATDIAAALNYAKDLFTNPRSGKIVLITDGKETDEEARTVIGGISAQGIRVDTVFIGTDFGEGDVQIVSVEMPNYHVEKDNECIITVNLQSKVEGTGIVEIYDNGVVSETGTQEVNMIEGAQIYQLKHTFMTEGLHEIAVKITTSDDSLKQNNQYYAYLNVEVFNKILILQAFDGESTALETMLTENNMYKVTVKSFNDEDLPVTVNGLREYDQVILNNVANEDMPEGFDEVLYSYVNDYGGGLFTVGGNDSRGSAHAYNKNDMYGSLYQQMLPVQAIRYTPPLGVIIIIDRSGSMSTQDADGFSSLDFAKAGAAACLEAMSERDYIGIMSLGTEYNTILPLTQRTREAEILDAINGIEIGGGTIFTNAIERASIALRAEKRVDKKHIIVVSDCQIGDTQAEEVGAMRESLYQNDGITFSIVAVDCPAESSAAIRMREKVLSIEDERNGKGRLHFVREHSELVRQMREDLTVPEIQEVNPEDFKPTITNVTSSLIKGVQYGTSGEDRNKMTVELGGFYGVKAREQAEVVLVGEYDVPIYAQWKFGEGMVGSFMCDLKGTWSSEFMSDSNGKIFLRNVLNNLMPVRNIRPNEISIDLKGDNYLNRLSVYTDLKNGEYVTGEIINTSSKDGTKISLNDFQTETVNKNFYLTNSLNAESNYTRCGFVIKESGIYKIVLTKHTADGKEIVLETYKEFSYSKEYDTYLEYSNEELKNNLSSWAEKGNGKRIEKDDPWSVFEDFIKVFTCEFDPTLMLVIIAMVLFLLDIAVRKFKFKWLHEIIRDRKAKKNQQ